jgi:sugar lactone lactonase YvrE
MDFNSMDWADTTGDGYGNVGGLDADLDGRYDLFAFDVDGNGYIEGYAWDTTRNGSPDTVSIDTDGNGYVDSAGWDTNGNGIVDHLQGPATGGIVIAVDETTPEAGPGMSVIGGPSGYSEPDALSRLIAGADPYEQGLFQTIRDSENDMIDRITRPHDPYGFDR